MIRQFQRNLVVYTIAATVVPKQMLVYNIWIWMSIFVEIITTTIFVFFWRAIYADQALVAGLTLQATLNYILLARVIRPLSLNTNMIYRFGRLLREGEITTMLLRPLDLQASMYGDSLMNMLCQAIIQIPMLIVALLVFGLQLPSDPLLWGCFVVSLLLGRTALFFLDWTIGCISFYITESWGLSMMRVSIGTFLSGAFVPLTMMPAWLERLALALPFAQALYLPTSFLSGITPAAAAPRIWRDQIIALVVLGVLSRLVFNRSLRTITVQGG